MMKPARMASDGEFAAKGQGRADPHAALAPEPPPALRRVAAAPAVPADELPDYITQPEPRVSRTQIGLRLENAVYDELLALSRRSRVPMQRICADAIAKFLAEAAAATGKGRR